jgi:hypothetical protein
MASVRAFICGKRIAFFAPDEGISQAGLTAMRKAHKTASHKVG